MPSPKSLICAQIADWCLELVPVWEVPVTVTMLQRAYPSATKHAFANALRRLTEANVLFTTVGVKAQTFYLPTTKRKLCDIQTLICKGRLELDGGIVE